MEKLVRYVMRPLAQTETEHLPFITNATKWRVRGSISASTRSQSIRGHLRLVSLIADPQMFLVAAHAQEVKERKAEAKRKMTAIAKARANEGSRKKQV
jgi:hypothetical protein